MLLHGRLFVEGSLLLDAVGLWVEACTNLSDEVLKPLMEVGCRSRPLDGRDAWAWISYLAMISSALSDEEIVVEGSVIGLLGDDPRPIACREGEEISLYWPQCSSTFWAELVVRGDTAVFKWEVTGLHGAAHFVELGFEDLLHAAVPPFTTGLVNDYGISSSEPSGPRLNR